MAFVDFEYYSALHSAVKDESGFERAEQLAEQAVARVIGPIRYADLVEAGIAGEFYERPLKDCICRIIDYNTQTDDHAGRGISSASNDGYSESYVLATQSAADAELAASIRGWLSGTGLVRAY